MAQINLNSISGITSITTRGGMNDVLTLHNNNTTEAVKLDGAGNLHFHNHLNITGVSTSSNFKTGSSNLHSAGVEVAGINVLGADTPIGAGSTIYNSGAAVFTGVVTATQFKGDGSNLSGLASREVYGFTGIGNSLSLTTTNSGADNIDNATYVSFEESFIGPSGLSFSINTSGNLIMSV